MFSRDVCHKISYKKMKVLLVKPTSGMHVVLPPIGLGYLASYCQRDLPGAEFRILDCHKERYTREMFESYVREYMPDVVGFTALSMELDSALRLSSATKRMIKNAVTVIGGPHASAAPQSVLSHADVDYIFRGEGEKGFSYFLKNFSSSERLRAPGLGYRDGDNIILNAPELIENLDDIPFPDYKKMRFARYTKMYFMKRFPAAPIMSSRGCPFQCTFCAGHNVSGRKWRSRTVGNILEEIEYLRREYGIKEVDFWDDNFTLDRKRIEEFCASLKSLNRNIIWWCPNGIYLNTVDRDNVKYLGRF